MKLLESSVKMSKKWLTWNEQGWSTLDERVDIIYRLRQMLPDQNIIALEFDIKYNKQNNRVWWQVL